MAKKISARTARTARTRTAPRPKNLNSVILYEGLSQLDGRTPIVVIATGLQTSSTNSKTGAMIQTYIIRSDMAPLAAVMAGADGGICGGCPHRLNLKTGIRTCYVILGKAPRGIYKAYKARRYAKATANDPRFLGAAIRFGAYGDPAAAPLELWQTLAAMASRTTGYTHQWRAAKFRGLANLVQASCETASDVVKANAKGYGTFRVLPQGDAIPKRALDCPASAERGKITDCASCGACDGSGRNVAIHAHGASGRRYLPTLQEA